MPHSRRSTTDIYDMIKPASSEMLVMAIIRLFRRWKPGFITGHNYITIADALLPLWPTLYRQHKVVMPLHTRTHNYRPACKIVMMLSRLLCISDYQLMHASYIHWLCLNKITLLEVTILHASQLRFHHHDIDYSTFHWWNNAIYLPTCQRKLTQWHGSPLYDAVI